MLKSNSDIIISADPKMKKLLEVSESVAASRASVFIYGESGTGKELLARYIHAKSPRSSSPLIAVNCAAIPGGLIESDLFGHERGSFTGAYATVQGKFELADGGTLFLDEVTELSLDTQAKLLRVLQENELTRVGGQKVIKINVRVIAATNKNIEELIRLGRFREDLYYRLNVVPLSIPALRFRSKDLESLAQYFLDVSCDNNDKETKSLSAEALAKLKSHKWPGNVRELQNVVERAVLLSSTCVIQEGDIVLDASSEVLAESPILSPGMTVFEAEKLLILNTLEYTSNNKSQAARMLGISVRTLRNKLHEYRGEAYE